MADPNRAVLIDIARSPFGRAKETGALRGLHPVDLAATLIQHLIEKHHVDPARIDDVILGTAGPVGEQGGNIGRHAALAAGLPPSVPGIQIDRKCGSGQQAFDFAAHGIIAGTYDLVIAGGVELMGVVPMRANRLGKDVHGSLLRRRYPAGLPHQGISAELIAARYGLRREAIDAYALRSHRLAAAFEDPFLVPIDVPSEGGVVKRVTRDEGVRPDTSAEKLAKLLPSFVDPAEKARFPEIDWRITAGSSSQVSDGASVALVASEEVARELGLRPRARFVASTVVGEDPILALTAVIPATRRLLSRVGMRIEEIGRFEVNEAFAAVVLAWLAETKAPLDRVNVHGGAIAVGHPVGASGVRLLGSLVAALEESGERYGLQVMCEGGGMANSLLVERVDA